MSRTTLFEKNKGTFYDSFESLPRRQMDDLVRGRLHEIIELAESSTPFYQARLETYDAQSEHPLLNIPVLEAADLRGVNLPESRALLSDQQANDFTVFQSGGTTGSPKTTLFTYEEMEEINFCNARGFYATGMKPTDRVANFWAVGGLYMTFIHMNRMMMEYGCQNFPFSNHTPAEFVYNVCQQFDVNCFSGIASVVLNNLRQMEELFPEAPYQVEKVYYGGEHLYPADRQELKEKYGVQKILAPGYGTVDTWYIGYQCLDTKPGHFHTHEDQCYVEIIDEETGQPCAPGETGMLYATPLLRRLTPIIRYRVGDLARWNKEACQCGRMTKVFELLGRGDDQLRIGYDSVDYSFVQNVVLKVPGLSGSIQMQKERRQGKDQLALRIETDLPTAQYSESIQRLDALFMKERPSFSEFVKKGTVWPLKIELLAKGSLPRNSRTGKLMRVKDVL